MSKKLQVARTALSWMESEMHSLNRNQELQHQLSSDVREVLNDHDRLQGRVAMLEDFVAGSQLDAWRALDPDYVPKEVEEAMTSLLERCKVITHESDPDDIEPSRFIKEIQAEAVEDAARACMPGPFGQPDNPPEGYNEYCEGVASVFEYARRLRKDTGEE